jgi:hypothetical protein
MDRDRNNPMGIGTNTYTLATIISQELRAHFGRIYNVNSDSYTPLLVVSTFSILLVMAKS